jgi:hypothetical protein
MNHGVAAWLSLAGFPLGCSVLYWGESEMHPSDARSPSFHPSYKGVLWSRFWCILLERNLVTLSPLRSKLENNGKKQAARAKQLGRRLTSEEASILLGLGGPRVDKQE